MSAQSSENVLEFYKSRIQVRSLSTLDPRSDKDAQVAGRTIRVNAWELRCWEGSKQRVALSFLQTEPQDSNKDFSMVGDLSLVPGRA